MGVHITGRGWLEIYADFHFGRNMTYMLRSALSIKRAVFDAWNTKSKEEGARFECRHMYKMHMYRHMNKMGCDFCSTAIQ